MLFRSAQPDTSYDSLKDYLRIVFSYAGTASMDTEAQPIPLSDLQVGDVFLKGGNPGHVVMVVDLCENADGKKAFLLAQGYMPAQQFHVLKNPAHEDDPADMTRPHPIPRKLSQKTMRSTGASGITTRFQELFRSMGQVGHALLTRSPLSPPSKIGRASCRERVSSPV